MTDAVNSVGLCYNYNFPLIYVQYIYTKLEWSFYIFKMQLTFVAVGKSTRSEEKKQPLPSIAIRLIYLYIIYIYLYILLKTSDKMLHLRLDNTENASLRTFTWRPIYIHIYIFPRLSRQNIKHGLFFACTLSTYNEKVLKKTAHSLHIEPLQFFSCCF